MKIESFTFKREAYILAAVQYGLPLLGVVVITVLWLFGYF
jgi:hypothetical protein